MRVKNIKIFRSFLERGLRGQQYNKNHKSARYKYVIITWLYRGTHLVLAIKTKVIQSRASYTQYITIPSAMVRDSQYPFKSQQEVEIVVFPQEGKLEVRPLGNKSKSEIPSG
jgi:hypothetical protein